MNVNVLKTLIKEVFSFGAIERSPGSEHPQWTNVHFSRR